MFKVGDKVRYIGNIVELQGCDVIIKSYNPSNNAYTVPDPKQPHRYYGVSASDLCKSSQSKFEIGGKVHLKPSSKFFGDGGNNPDKESDVGEIYNITHSSIWVSWDDCNNSYDEDELISIDSIPKVDYQGPVSEKVEDTGCKHEFVDIYGFTGKLMGRSCKHCDIREEDLTSNLVDASNKIVDDFTKRMAQGYSDVRMK